MKSVKDILYAIVWCIRYNQWLGLWVCCAFPEVLLQYWSLIMYVPKALTPFAQHIHNKFLPFTPLITPMTFQQNQLNALENKMKWTLTHITMQDNFPISQLLIQLCVPLKRESEPLAVLGCLYMLNIIKESTQQATAGWHCCLNSSVSPISDSGAQ